MLYELTEEYIPDNFLYRDLQINRIKQIFQQFKNYRYCTNLAVLGSTGAGKTSILQKVVKEENNTIYATVTQYPTVNKLLKYLSGLNYHSTSDLLNGFIEKMKADPKILVIDEVGKFSQQETIEFYNIINTIFRRTNIPIIIITNKFNFISDMPEDAKLTLMFERIEFRAYSALQLQGILQDRCEIISSKNVALAVPEGAIEYIAAKVVREHMSSTRIALRILSKCIVNNNFEISFINKCSEDVREQDFQELLQSLHATEKDCLEAILELTNGMATEISVSTISSKMKISPAPTPNRISQIVSSFVDKGLIKTEVKNLGRAGGKYRVISIARKDYKDKLLKLLHPWEGEE